MAQQQCTTAINQTNNKGELSTHWGNTGDSGEGGRKQWWFRMILQLWKLDMNSELCSRANSVCLFSFLPSIWNVFKRERMSSRMFSWLNQNYLRSQWAQNKPGLASIYSWSSCLHVDVSFCAMKFALRCIRVICSRMGNSVTSSVNNGLECMHSHMRAHTYRGMNG